MAEIKLSIDGVEVTADERMTVLEAALANGIYIPHLCHHPDLRPAGVCRVCMVEINGKRVDISCKTPVEHGMQVRTETPEVNRIRRVAVELLFINHPADCLSCSANNQCELQRVANFVGLDESHLARLRRREPGGEEEVDRSNPFFVYDKSRCILCGICVRTCDDIAGVGTFDFAYRGFKTFVSTYRDQPLLESRCVSCGECVSRCPVGALRVKEQLPPSREVKTVCPYCGVGCVIHLGVRGQRVVSSRADRDNPVNRGRLCVKGRFGFEFVNHPQRLTTPLIRESGKFREAGWDEALALVAEKLSRSRGDAFACLSSAKCTNEENYIVQKFARAVMGTNNVDHCARLCHAPSVAGLAQSFGSGAMTNSIGEISDARCFLAIGTNTTSAHPVIAYYIKEAVRGGARLIVANPREIDLCEHAHLFLQHRPGTDVPLMMGMARIILEEGLEDRAFIRERCENYEAFAESLEQFDPDTVQSITGVDRRLLREAAVTYATHRPAMLFYAMGITQHTHGTDNVLATSNLALLTGNVGRRSSGVNPLRGQNNVQGACDMGALPNVYPGYQKLDVPAIRRKFEQAWRAELSPTPGLTHVEIFDAILSGEVKALYQVGENPALSEANAGHVLEAVEKLDFFVAQDIFLTETARHAHVVLPAASFAEKDGTFTNTERRVQRVRRAILPVGESRPDWEITCMIAREMGAHGFDFAQPSQIMDEIAALTPSYGGMSFARLEYGSLQWPCPGRDSEGTPFLHADFFATATGKGKFLPLSYLPPHELPDGEYPLILTTERSLYHFHTSTMTRKGGLEVIRSHEDVEMNPADARKLGLRHGQMVRVVSRRGAVEAPLKVTETSSAGVVSMTFHFAESPTNMITSSALDPVAKIPETKVCAVRVEAVPTGAGRPGKTERKAGERKASG
ncbi:MAG: formate dehydrogenase subunit alpha [Spirochaetota bacterium]